MTAASDSPHVLRAVFAELRFPAPVWLLVAQAHSWGVNAECVDKLSHLPSKDYQGFEDVSCALEQLSHDWPGHEADRESRVRGSEVTRRGVTAVTDAAAVPPEFAASRSRQHKTVGEGLAVGLLALGVDAVTINERLVQTAFDRAWEKWTRGSRFPAVRTGPGGNDIVAILRGSARRRGPHIADWSCDGEYVPKLRVDRTVDAAARAVGKQSGVTYEQWLELATGSAAHLNTDLGEIRYRESGGLSRSA